MPIYYWIPIILIVLFFVVILVMQFFYNEKKVILRQLKKEGLTPYEQIKEGDYVFVKGTVDSNSDAINAPISSAACCLFSMKSWVMGNQGESVVAERSQCTPFTIICEGNTISIKAQDIGQIEYNLIKKLNTNRLDDTENKERITSFLKERNFRLTNPITKQERNVYFEEHRLDLNDSLIVKGVARWTRDSEGQPKLELVAEHKKKLLVTNDPEAFPKNSSN